MNTPGGSPITINGLILKVQAALQNRSDVTESQSNPEMRPSAWIRDALREITESQPFEELRTSGPLVNIGPGLGANGSSYAYLISYFLNSGDDYTMTEDPVIFLSPVQAQSVGLVTNGGGAYGMDYVTPKAIQPLLFIPGGIPFKYTRYGNQFWFGTQPGSNFQVYLPYQIRHPFNDDDLLKSPVLVPPSWLDIVAYAAAERGAVVNRWNDQATYLHNLLYGDPKSQLSDGTLGRPGLIAARTFQMERDKRLSAVQMMPVVARY